MELIIVSKAYGTHTVYYDDEDHELVSAYHWMIVKGKKGVFYVRGYIGKKSGGKGVREKIRMHRLIMGAVDEQEVDHINHDGRNNRRNNLRFANDSQSSANTRVHVDSSTGFKGVTFRKKKKLYCARIRVNGKLIHGGLHKNIYKAALKYNEMAKKYFGEFAHLNELSERELELAKEDIPPRVPSTSPTGYRGVGVSKNMPEKPFIVILCQNKKRIYIGNFPTEIEAAKAYNEALIKHGGDLRKLNKIPEQ